MNKYKVYFLLEKLVIHLSWRKPSKGSSYSK